MKLFLITASVAGLLALPAAAQYLGSEQPEKSDGHLRRNQVIDDRQGGDTVADATVIPVFPHTDSGATCGFNDDYDESCPYDGSTSPDVVYAYHATQYHYMTIDLCGSAYDTKVYVYDENLMLIACNDDFYFDDGCGAYVSRLDHVPFEPDHSYYIVVDGYGGDCGAYEILFMDATLQSVECPPDGVPEGEPPLQDEYVDGHNGGCNSPEFGSPMQELRGQGDGSLDFCGVAGWYDYQSSDYRDTDWFTCYADATGNISWDFIAELTTNIFHLGPTNCDDVVVLQQITAWIYLPVTMTIDAEPYELIWLWVGSNTYDPPDGWPGNEYEYVFTLSGILDEPVAAQTATWSSLKMMFR